MNHQKLVGDAHRQVRTAIDNGTLVRPGLCSKCDRPGKKSSDGRATIHAHHNDYSKPLLVEWLCTRCHREETPLPKVIGAPNFGEKNGYSKLNNELVKEILESKESAVKLGHKLGVNHSTISRVRNGERWRAQTGL